MADYLQVTCSKSNLAVIRDFVRERLLDCDVHGKMAGHIVLAVDEACANCIIHQHDCDGTSLIEVGVVRKDDNVEVFIKDTGEAFPIDAYEPQPLMEIIHDRKKGGLGIGLIHRIMDHIGVEKHNGYHLYTFVKKIEE